MSKNFSVIKKKYLVASVIASAGLGACCGIIVACLLAVIFKTSGISFHWALYIPIALVIAAGAGFLLFLLLRPTDVKVAKKLDKDFALSQKAQTMVEFREAEGEMFVMQREQADEALACVAKKRADWSFLLKFLAIPVLAVALLLAGVLVPFKKSTQAGPPIFDFTDTQKAALDNLISDVNASSLKDGIKEPTIATLQGLRAGLEDKQPQSVMRTAVRSSVKIIDSLIAAANSYGKIGTALYTNEKLKDFAYAILDSATFYIEPGKTIKMLSQVNAKADMADEQIENILLNYASKVLIAYTVGRDEDEEADESEVVPIPMAQASAQLSEYAALVSAKLEESGFAPKEDDETVDALYAVLLKFVERMNVCANATSGMNDNTYYSTIVGVFNDFASIGGDAVPVFFEQAYNNMMDEFIRNRLAEIFKLNVAEFGESPVVTTPNRSDGSNENKPGNTGGYGEGGTKYAGDDPVLNTEFDDGSLIAYGEVLRRYEQFFEEMMENGTCPDDLAAYIRKYFQILYDGIKAEEENA